MHWSILRQGASHRFSLYCILLFCFVLCIVSAVDYSVWHSEAHYGIQCVNASQPVRGTMDSRQPPNSDRQTPQLCSINCNELFRNAYMACFATHWSIMHKVGKYKEEENIKLIKDLWMDGRSCPLLCLPPFIFKNIRLKS